MNQNPKRQKLCLGHDTEFQRDNLSDASLCQAGYSNNIEVDLSVNANSLRLLPSQHAPSFVTRDKSTPD